MASAVSSPRPQPKYSPRPRTRGRRRVGFVCIGNSCRSQMAEAWVRYLNRTEPGGVEVEAVSAGLQALGYVSPETIEVMKEKNVSLEGHQSKGLEAVDWNRVDVLVNMTEMPVRSIVPGFQGQRVEWKIEDPFNEPLRVHRRVRDLLEKKVRKLLSEIQSTSSGPAAPPVS